MTYDHTQTGPLALILLAAAVSMFMGGWLVPEPLVGRIVMASGGLLVGLAFCFRELQVRDEGDWLLVRFGPLPLFQRRIAYADIVAITRCRSTILDGWGIHLSPSGGWTWNLWGFDCVDVRRQGKSKLRIGTDDPEGLAAFLQRRIGQVDPADAADGGTTDSGPQLR